MKRSPDKIVNFAVNAIKHVLEKEKIDQKNVINNCSRMVVIENLNIYYRTNWKLLYVGYSRLALKTTHISIKYEMNHYIVTKTSYHFTGVSCWMLYTDLY